VSAPGTVAVHPDGIRRTGPGIDERRAGVRVRHTPQTFELTRERPSEQAVYLRIGYGGLEWGDDLRAFLPAGDRPRISPGLVLALVHGLTPPPDATLVPGVRRLTLGTRVRADASGVTTSHGRPPEPAPATTLTGALGEALSALGPRFSVAFSGGLSSSFLAAGALAAGHRPALLQAEPPWPAPDAGPPAVPGLAVRHVPFDAMEALDHHQVTGEELAPPLPDVVYRRHLADALVRHSDGPVAFGSLLEELASTTLPEVDAGRRDWRLLTCEPFHAGGTVRGLRAARETLAGGPQRAAVRPLEGELDEVQSVEARHEAARAGRMGGSGLPGLTDDGRHALMYARSGMLAVWKQRKDRLRPATGRLEAGMEERGLTWPFPHDDAVVTPALHPAVLAAVTALPPRGLGRIRGGVLENHLPLRRAVGAAGVTGVRYRSARFGMRLAAAAYLRRERGKIIAELRAGSALADLGMIEPGVIAELLADGAHLADHALPLLRLVWLDRWMRG
jgi:hypothetical protein